MEDGLADTVITALSRANGDDLVLGWIGLLSILAENGLFSPSGRNSDAVQHH